MTERDIEFRYSTRNVSNRLQKEENNNALEYLIKCGDMYKTNSSNGNRTSKLLCLQSDDHPLRHPLSQ